MKNIHTLGAAILLACTLIATPAIAQSPQPSVPTAPAPVEQITPQQAIARALLQTLTLNAKYHTFQRLPQAECEKKLAAETVLNGCPDDFREFYKEMLSNWHNSAHTYDMEAAGIKLDQLLAKYGLVSYGHVARYFKQMLGKTAQSIPQDKMEAMSAQERKKHTEQMLDKMAESIIQLQFDIKPMLAPTK